MGLWTLFAIMGLEIWPFTWGSAVLGHAHELILGFGLAALTGFILTAVPEFTKTAVFSAQSTRILVIFWILGRLAFWSAASLESFSNNNKAAYILMIASGVFHALLLQQLAKLIFLPLWRQAERKHISFFWIILIFLILHCGLYANILFSPENAMSWIHAFLAVFMAAIVLAVSRISMSVLNDALQKRGVREPDGQPRVYVARAPKRNLALLAGALHTLSFLLDAPATTQSWLAAATAAALLFVLDDWHVGRALWTRWSLALYAVYGLAALGYGLLAAAGFGVVPAQAGWHVLGVGAFSLAILLVCFIVVPTHSGLNKDADKWAIYCSILLIGSTLSRAMAYFEYPILFLTLAALLWIVAFVAAGWKILPILWNMRRDEKTGAAGCDGFQLTEN